MQAVYILTGCDILTSRESAKYFFSCSFSTCNFYYWRNGCIRISGIFNFPRNSHLGQLAFVRLVGCAYFKEHLSGFKFDTPEALFPSITVPSIKKQHIEWLDIIRTTVWERSYDECHYVPSYAALEFHWKRCTWVARYWGQAVENEIQMAG